MKIHCDGECWFYPHQNETPCECEGKVVRVEVFTENYSWGKFNYCEKAIEKDLANGFMVKVLD